MKKCERCGAKPKNDPNGLPQLLDYCAVCSKDLCPDCMAKGCCGNVPARSGENDEPESVADAARRGFGTLHTDQDKYPKKE